MDRSELIIFNIKEHNLIRINTIPNVHPKHLVIIENEHQLGDYRKFIILAQKNDLKRLHIFGTINGDQCIQV